MPFCHISQDVSLHYVTNSPSGDTMDFDHTKPTIILLPPIFCAVGWLREQFKDPRLSSRYNLLAFDQRNMGQTKAPFSSKRDTWVDAADIALAHELLQLPPCHVFAVSMNSCGAALRFSQIFPDKCLSLCLCQVPNQAGEDPDWVPHGYLDLLDAWCFPRDLETTESASMELSWFMFNEQIPTELEDEIVAWWQVNLSPRKRSNYLAQGLCGMHRHRFSDQELASIKQPTLFIQGDKSLHNPPSKAQHIAEKLPNSRTFVVKGGPELMTIIPQYASIIHRVYCQFLQELPNPPAFQPSKPDPEGISQEALARLAIIASDPEIARRDRADILSFCLFSPDRIKENDSLFAEFAKGESEAFHALNEHGRPIRKLSERNRDQWTPAAFSRNGLQLNQGDALVTVTEASSIST